MDIVEVAEKMFDVKLPEWQKEYIRTLDRLGKDAKIYVRLPTRYEQQKALYFYLNTKELVLNGTQNDSE